MVLLAGKYNSSVGEHDLGLNEVVHAETMKSSQKAETTEKHHSRACGMGRTKMAKSDATSFHLCQTTNTTYKGT